jgi:hypothetical protein
VAGLVAVVEGRQGADIVRFDQCLEVFASLFELMFLDLVEIHPDQRRPAINVGLS